MALRGTLGDFSLADILQLIGLQRKTGILMLRHGDEEITVGFESGRVVSADSNLRPAEQKIGQLLIRRGKLSTQRLDEALRVQKETLQRLGYVLHDRKWVDRETLQRQLSLQITETVFGLFRWKGGEYDFQPRERVEWDRDFVNPIPAEHLLMEGARMVDEWPIVERVIPDSDVVLRPTQAALRVLSTGGESQEARGSIYDQDIDFGFIPSDPLSDTDTGPRLSPIERQVLRWIDGKRAAYEIAELTELGSFETFKTMARLIELKLIERGDPAEGADTRPQPKAGVRLFQSDRGARLAGVLLGLLTLFGAVVAIWPIVGLVNPSAPALAPTPVASTAWIERSSGLARLQLTMSIARMNRIEQAIEIYYLDTAEWPQQLSDLVDHDLLAPATVLDPWGRPYQLQLFMWGYRVSQLPVQDGERPVIHERRFTALQQEISNIGRAAMTEPAPTEARP